ncbi:uncharacterized protein N7487_003972 [Penicillium crustosum]|uniref:uncharacterized protein n=1 Tax=Penicillium crustosum TaxID=36656 RepID=UPI0023A14C70|nr:uncharacterized protein N7487_003972 [Penicillium crustosum]KAJ5409613.1 hypothetical protein N7487_003972 [Penicillium crustosum]
MFFSHALSIDSYLTSSFVFKLMVISHEWSGSASLFRLVPCVYPDNSPDTYLLPFIPPATLATPRHNKL